jgi:GH18 family chitinase
MWSMKEGRRKFFIHLVPKSKTSHVFFFFISCFHSGKKGFMSLPVSCTIHHQNQQGQELKPSRKQEARADAEAMEPDCLLLRACLAPFL